MKKKYVLAFCIFCKKAVGIRDESKFKSFWILIFDKLKVLIRRKPKALYFTIYLYLCPRCYRKLINLLKSSFREVFRTPFTRAKKRKDEIVIY